jgi:hypothetical protein
MLPLDGAVTVPCFNLNVLNCLNYKQRTPTDHVLPLKSWDIPYIQVVVEIVVEVVMLVVDWGLRSPLLRCALRPRFITATSIAIRGTITLCPGLCTAISIAIRLTTAVWPRLIAVIFIGVGSTFIFCSRLVAIAVGAGSTTAIARGIWKSRNDHNKVVNHACFAIH